VQQVLNIFEIESAHDILQLPNVAALRKELVALYQKGGPEIEDTEDRYIDLVNSLCVAYGLPPYFEKGPAHP